MQLHQGKLSRGVCSLLLHKRRRKTAAGHAQLRWEELAKAKHVIVELLMLKVLETVVNHSDHARRVRLSGI